MASIAKTLCYAVNSVAASSTKSLATSDIPYTQEVAEIAGRIDAEQRHKGFSIPFTDLLIGATALSLGFGIVTANVHHFLLIPGLNVIQFE